MNNINPIIYGDFSNKEILQVIREHLCLTYKMLYGIIVFYKFDPESSKAKLNVFPINEDIIDKHFPDDEAIRDKYLSAIISDRDYEEFYYCNEFREKKHTIEHFDIVIKDRNKILGHEISNINDVSWEEFIEKIENYNILDQLFFSPNQSKFKVIPLPILYSPATLIIIPLENFDNSEMDKIFLSISESIHFFLFNKLLTELSNDIKIETIGNNKQELIREFLKQLIEIAIPIKYECFGEVIPCFDWYGEGKTESSKIIELNLAEEKVHLYMPTFHWHDNKRIDGKEEFIAKEKQVVQTIENIFNLVHSNWKVINDTKRHGKYVLKQIVEDSGLNLHSLESISSEIDKIKNAVKKAVNITDEEYNKSINTVASKEVRFKRNYNDNGNEIGYSVYLGNDFILESNIDIRGGYKDFGYEILQEIINAERKKIKVNEFTFYEDVRNELKKHIKTESEGKVNGKSISGIDNDYDNYEENEIYAPPSDEIYIKMINDSIKNVNLFVDLFKKEKINDFNNFLNYFNSNSKINLDSILNLFSEYKKEIDQAKFSKLFDYQINKKITQSSLFLNKWHKIFVENFSDYLQNHKESKSPETAKLLRSRKDGRTADSRVNGRIYNNLDQLIFKLINHITHGEVFQNNFEQAGLENEPRKFFIYDKSKIDITNTLEWFFE